MNAMNLNEWILAATFVVAAVLVSIALARMVRRDGYGTRTPLTSSDWGTAATPSRPYVSRL